MPRPVIAFLFQSTLLHEERRLSCTHFAEPNHFNPRSYMRSDVLALRSRLNSVIFQSTLLHEERRATTKLYQQTLANFNPRSYMRSDTDKLDLDGNIDLFQSTLLHEERLANTLLTTQALGISIHAPTWGATNAVVRKVTAEQISIHAPTWGATSTGQVGRGSPKNFNPRSYMRSDFFYYII